VTDDVVRNGSWSEAVSKSFFVVFFLVSGVVLMNIVIAV
jgi:hypothetical protein